MFPSDRKQFNSDSKIWLFSKMTNEEIAIKKYINEKKELQQLVLKIVDSFVV